MESFPDASTPLSEELCCIRRAVLANLSYAHLQVEDWCSALQVARALLAISSATTTAGLLAATTLNSTDSAADSSPPAATDAAAATSSSSSSSFPSISPTSSASSWSAAAAEYAFLAHSYAAEALCHLDRPADAVEYLSLWLMIAQEREVTPGQVGGRNHNHLQYNFGYPHLYNAYSTRQAGEVERLVCLL